MKQKLQITLPVMMHFDAEIQTFLEAKSRLESIGDGVGVPLEVGAFLPFMPAHSRKPESFEKQLRNQEIHKLPIRLVETGIYHTNALSYVPGNPTYDAEKPSDLERVVIQGAKMRDLDSTAPKALVVAPHVGIFVIGSLAEGDFSHPSIYSVADFVKLRERLLQDSKQEFDRLEGVASGLGLQLAVESSHLACMQDDLRYWEKGTHGYTPLRQIDYQVLNDIVSLKHISSGNLVLDANHLAVNQNVPRRFKDNGYDPSHLFSTMNISSWEEYGEKTGEVADYLPLSHAIHISPVDGIGVRLEGTEEGKLWGDGTGPDTTSRESYKLLLDEAHRRNLPVALEPEFGLKPLTYREADEFLEPVLRAYVKDREN
ncbi:MAG: hypothetical protein Q8P57_00920 [Candidatus Pacearchaeota archaeon]|nr:hypothetical protein [Candidatus Pacearchaeota archaeon]